MQLNSYLLFNGQCEAAFQFYEKGLGGKIEAMIPHTGTPAEQQVPAEWRSKIMHARLTIGEHVLMGSDAPPERFQKPQGFSVNIEVNDPEEAERIFNELWKMEKWGCPSSKPSGRRVLACWSTSSGPHG